MKIDKELEYLSYPQAVELISDLAYIVIPFDKSQKEFQMLLGRLKTLLQAQTGMVRLHSLVDACLRLNVESLNTQIKKKIEEGNYSRAPEDLCTLLYFMAHQHHHFKMQKDATLLNNLLKEMKHMQFQNLKMEQLHYLLSALKYATDPQTLHALPEPIHVHVQEFSPRLMNQVFREITRCKLSDIVIMLQSFGKLWDKQVFVHDEMKQVYKQAEMYLLDYLGKYKKDITGTDFAILVSCLGFAASQKVHTFDRHLVHRLQHIFINDNSELYHFSYSDLLKILKGFEQLNEYFNKDKVIKMIEQLTLECESYEDPQLLELMKTFLDQGLMEQHQDLAVKARVYFQERFSFMDRHVILDYLDFFKDLGLIFEDKEVMEMLKEQFSKSFHTYELDELCKVFKLVSHNFYRDPETLQTLEDAVKIRVSEPSQRQSITVQGIKDLIEGLKLHTSINKRLDSSLKSLLKHNPHLLSQDKLLMIQYFCYLADFGQTIDQTLLNEQLSFHESELSQEDRLHLFTYLGDALPNKYRPSSEHFSSQLNLTLDTQEKLALCDIKKLDPKLVQQEFKEIFEGSNVTEIIEQLLKHYEKDYETRTILGEGRVKAAFYLPHDKVAIDIAEQTMAYYAQSIRGSKSIERQLRARFRRAQDILNKDGINYKVVSLVEMDFVTNEDKWLRDILGMEK